MKNKFLEMYKLQNTLNINTNGSEWTSGVTEQGRSINWYRCIYMEAAEAIDSLNWKHWKHINSQDDLENLKIELVDIWHFMMSQHIVDCEGDIEKAVDKSLGLFSHSKPHIATIEILETIVRTASSYQQFLEWFFAAINSVDNFDMDKVYSLYIGKNCLNQFRQDHGYKEGTYIKVWNGEEDNVYMQNVLSAYPHMGYDELYDWLETTYKRCASPNLS